MASFEAAYQELGPVEGKYSNDSLDLGGETYRGVSRRFHPYWSGWKIIDDMKKLPGFPENLETVTALKTQVRELYKEQYWDIFWGDAIPDDPVAAELLDISVNLGPPRAITFLQRAINVLNNRGKLYSDIEVDGWFGGETYEGLQSATGKRSVPHVLAVLNVLQGAHYIDRMEEDETQERFAGWLKRVEVRWS